MNWTSYALCILVSITLGCCSLEPAPRGSIQRESSSPKPKEKSLPEKCRHLLAEPDPKSWNDTTQLYTIPGGSKNSAWMKCMGVSKASYRRHMFRSDI